MGRFSSHLVSERSKDVGSHEVLREIVRLDFWRILSRLRSRHAKRSRKTAGKPPLVAQLSAAVNNTLLRKHHKLSENKVSALRERVHVINNLFSALEALLSVEDELCEAQELLMCIVEHLNEVAKGKMLTSMLDAIEEPNIEVRNHLLSSVGKLGRYYSASQDLIHAVRREQYSIFNRICVESFQLPSMPKSHVVEHASTLQSSINDLVKRETSCRSRGAAFSAQKYLGKFYSSKEREFQKRTSSSSVPWKVHAEIQLLFFHELHKVDLPPRAICASKSPCYLCHLFFGVHGKYYVPETHGRLYPGWILPTWLCDISKDRQREIGQMIDDIHAKIFKQIRYILPQQRNTCKPPKQSVLCIQATWSASTLRSQSHTEASEKSIGPSQASQDMGVCKGNFDRLEVSAKHQGSTSSSSSRRELLQPSSDAIHLAHQQTTAQPGSLMTASYILRPGDTMDIFHDTERMSIHIKTEYLSLTISRGPISGNASSESCWLRCRLIDMSDIDRSASQIQSVDLLGMKSDSQIELEDGSLHSANKLLLVAYDQALSVKYSCSRLPVTTS